MTLACPIPRIHGFWTLAIPAGHRTTTFSTPGHLLHLVTSGRYQLTIDRREFEASAGDVIWYFEAEKVVWRRNLVPVEFLSIGFDCPALAAPQWEDRLFRATPRLRTAFSEVERAARDGTSQRDLLLFRATLELILALEQHSGRGPAAPGQNAPNASPWRRVELEVRRRHWHRVSLKELAAWSGASRATLLRSCRSATGLSPAARLRELRIDYARALLQFSPMTLGEIAAELGYGRVHEFSREFRRVAGKPPGEFRRSG